MTTVADFDNIPWTPTGEIDWNNSNLILASTIGKLIDLDTIVDRLLATNCQQCSLFTHDQVKLAFLKWIEQHIESIEMQPEWFINRDFKHFDRNLPFDDLQEATDLREYDNEETYAEMARESEQFDNESLLEDDFEGTPEQAALEATYW